MLFADQSINQSEPNSQSSCETQKKGIITTHNKYHTANHKKITRRQKKCERQNVTIMNLDRDYREM